MPERVKETDRKSPARDVFAIKHVYYVPPVLSNIVQDLLIIAALTSWVVFVHQKLPPNLWNTITPDSVTGPRVETEITQAAGPHHKKPTRAAPVHAELECEFYLDLVLILAAYGLSLPCGDLSHSVFSRPVNYDIDPKHI